MANPKLQKSIQTYTQGRKTGTGTIEGLGDVKTISTDGGDLPIPQQAREPAYSMPVVKPKGAYPIPEQKLEDYDPHSIVNV